MHCSKASKLLQLYIDNQLELKQIRPLEIHLAGCTYCQQETEMLEEITQSLQEIHLVAEPANLTVNIMQRVALSSRQHANEQTYSVWRPSLAEMITVVVLATIATLGIILQQPSLRAILPIANGHDALSLDFTSIVHSLLAVNIGTLTWILWIVGTMLGIFITLLLAGNEVRTQWFKSMRERLPAH